MTPSRGLPGATDSARPPPRRRKRRMGASGEESERASSSETSQKRRTSSRSASITANGRVGRRFRIRSNSTAAALVASTAN